jgi:hypothetical protein
MVRTDLELLTTAVNHVEAQFSRGGQHSQFVHGLQTMCRSVSAAVEPGTGLEQPKVSTSLDSRFDFDVPMISPYEDNSLLVSGFMPEATISGLADDMSFEELWGPIGTYPFLGHAMPGEPML